MPVEVIKERMQVREQRRIKVEGFADSDLNLVVAVMQLRDGQIGMAVQGVEPSLENLVQIRQLLDLMVRELDAKFPQMVQQSVKEMQRG
jgi:hypothetical protein